MLLQGRVVRAQSRSFEVETTQGPVRARVLKGLRTRFPGLVDPLAVGDQVLVRVVGGTEPTIEEVLPRDNRLSRPAVGQPGQEQIIAANLHRAAIVQSVRPPWKAATYDRYLVMASAGGIPPLLCLNKIDLDPEASGAPELGIYRELGIPVVITSAKTGEGLEELRVALRGGLSVLVGPSGAGKSSLVNALHPGASLPTAGLSRQTGKGRHTTTWVELLTLGDGIELADSPGLRVLGLWGVGPEDLAGHFPEMAALAGECRFSRCSHAHEPGCRVRAALEAGAIAAFRYESYVRIREAILAEDSGIDPSGRRRRPAAGFRKSG